jgi:hypothetical protein
MRLNPKIYFLILVLIILTGVFLRFSVFSQAPAFWLDEAYTANALIFLPFEHLIQLKGKCIRPYPVGFLGLSKITISVFGISDLALRFFPFLFGIIALFVFRRLCQKIFQPPWDLFALTLFTVCYPLISHSIELKPYSSDVLIATCLLLTAVNTICLKTMPPKICYVIIGVCALMFSFPSVFIIFPLLTIWALESFLKKDRSSLIYRIQISFFLLIVQISYYFYSLRHHISDPDLIEFWTMSFLPIASGFAACFKMLWVAFLNIFSEWGIPPVAGVIFMLIGMFTIAIKNPRHALICLTPMIAVLCASALRIYPFHARTVLFLTPILIILIVFGCQVVFLSKWKVIQKIMAYTCVILIFFTSFSRSAPMIKNFSFGEDIRPLITHLNNYRKQDEGLYLNNFSKQAYRFYQYLSPFPNPDDYVLVLDDTVLYDGIEYVKFCFDHQNYFIAETGNFIDLSKNPEPAIQPGRNWFLMAHTKHKSQKILFRFLDRIGTKILEKKSDKDATLYLYDITYQNTNNIYRYHAQKNLTPK